MAYEVIHEPFACPNKQIFISILTGIDRQFSVESMYSIRMTTTFVTLGSKRRFFLSSCWRLYTENLVNTHAHKIQMTCDNFMRRKKNKRSRRSTKIGECKRQSREGVTVGGDLSINSLQSKSSEITCVVTESFGFHRPITPTRVPCKYWFSNPIGYRVVLVIGLWFDHTNRTYDGSKR